ncbi:hypothetical protein [Methyloprofundus sedimenti]|nr:hypothetical protein [Methyloprofundus sedimenti]
MSDTKRILTKQAVWNSLVDNEYELKYADWHDDILTTRKKII